MPRGDRTGPNGLGQMTGRRMGYCAGFANTSGISSFGNFGFVGRGRGIFDRFGRGPGRNFAPIMYDRASEKTMLQNNINLLKEQLASLEKQLSQIGDEA